MQNDSFPHLLLVGLMLFAPSCAHVECPLQGGGGDSIAGMAPSPLDAVSADSRSVSRRTGEDPPLEADPSSPSPVDASDAILQVAYNEQDASREESPPIPPPAAVGAEEAGPEGPQEAADLPLPSGGTMTVDELEQMALLNNPTIQQATAAVNKARGIRTQVGLYPNPTIGYSGEEMGDDGTAGKQGGFISQTIVTADKLDLSQAVANQEIQNLSWELEAQRYRVRNSVRMQFYETLGAQQRVAIARQLVSVAERGVEVAQELLAAQQAARPDVLQAEIQLNEVRILLQNALFDYEASWKQLASLVGQPYLPPASLSGTLDAPSALRDFETTLAELVTTSPQLEAARARVARARTQIRRQEVQPIPNVLAQVGVSHDNATGDHLANVQLGLPLPIFNQNEGNIQLAVSELHRATNDLRRLELALRARLAAAFADFQKAQNQVERYREDILPTVEENLELTEDGYRLGEFGLIRALTARRSFFETNLAYIQSLVALRQADVTISGLLLIGGLDDVPDAAGGGNLQGVGLRGEALSGQ